jgi:hypothetical protein
MLLSRIGGEGSEKKSTKVPGPLTSEENYVPERYLSLVEEVVDVRQLNLITRYRPRDTVRDSSCYSIDHININAAA